MNYLYCSHFDGIAKTDCCSSCHTDIEEYWYDYCYRTPERKNCKIKTEANLCCARGEKFTRSQFAQALWNKRKAERLCK